MSLKFVNYAAFAAAGKQVDRDMSEFRKTYGTESSRGRTTTRTVSGEALKKEAVVKRSTKR